jgi:DNA-binding transcriptional regulator YiaG
MKTLQKPIANNTFKAWLAQKGFSYQKFSEQTGINYPTVVTWTRGTKPRDMAKKLLREKFPDCPLVKE